MSSSVSVVDLLDHRAFVPEVVALIRREWPKDREDREIERRLCGDYERNKLPTALLALLGSQAIGFVSLVYYDKGREAGRIYWIDALYVTRSYRGQGVALELLRHAEAKARTLGIDKLFALTEIPGLYLKAGWEKDLGAAVESAGDVVMTKRLA